MIEHVSILKLKRSRRVVTLSTSRLRVWWVEHDSYESCVFLIYFAPLNTLVLGFGLGQLSLSLEVDSVSNLHILNIYYPSSILSWLYTDVSRERGD